MRLAKNDFVNDSQFEEHKKFLKIEKCRSYSKIELAAGGLMVFYAIGLADHRFMVHYHAEGGASLYYEHASLDNVKTLKALIEGQS